MEGSCGLNNGCSSQSCTCENPSCYDNVLNGDETGIDCGGALCNAIPKRCPLNQPCGDNGDCASNNCGTGSTCEPAVCVGSPPTARHVCSNGNWVCAQGTIECGGTCYVPTDDPANCGSCDNACGVDNSGSGGADNSLKPYCMGGQCRATCFAGLTGCNGRCVDFQTDSENCGACTTMPLTDTVHNCTLTNKVCNYGSCITPLDYVTLPNNGCANGGLPIDLGPSAGTGSTSTCAGDIASGLFHWGICSCENASINQRVFIDGFDSTLGPYTACNVDLTACPGGQGQCNDREVCLAGNCVLPLENCLGAGFGVNGTVKFGVNSAQNASSIFGDLNVSHSFGPPALSSNIANVTIWQRLFSGPSRVAGTNSLTVGDGGSTTFWHDMYVDGTMQSSGGSATIKKTLYSTQYSAAPAGFVLGPSGSVVNQQSMTFTDPCDCTDPLDIIGIVDAHKCTGNLTTTSPDDCIGDNNDNKAAEMDPGILAGSLSNARLDIDCGHYWFTSINTAANVTVFVHGNAAIYVDGDLTAGQGLHITLGPTAQLDLFVKGVFNMTQVSAFGNPAWPANMRIYVGGQDGGESVRVTQEIDFAANLYAPHGATKVTHDLEIFGSAFTKSIINTTQPWTVHFDRAVVEVGSICSTCGDGIVQTGEECDTSNLGGKTCQLLGFDGGTLSCDSSCNLVNSCFNAVCGNGVKEGNEQCDGAQGVPASCAPGTGTPVCDSPGTCTVTGCTGCSCPGNLNCTAFAHSPPYTGGTVGCSVGSGCVLDFSACTYCGDGVINGSEQCDLTDFGSATCANVTGDPMSTGMLTCNANCTINSSACMSGGGGGGCGSGCDCPTGQGCNNGECGACTGSGQCCAPFVCISGVCKLILPP